MNSLVLASLLVSQVGQETTTYPVHGATLLTYVIDYEPYWAPDGKKIALISSRHGGLKLHVFELGGGEDESGSSMKQLTFGKSEEDSPAWSPNGTKIAYVSIRDGVSQICVMKSDGSEVKQLTDGKYNNIHPAWAPDGTRILFNTMRYEKENRETRGIAPGNPAIGEPQDNFIDLASVASDGSDWRRITKGGGYTYAFYSPDGKRIVHRRSIGEKSQIWVMNGDGTDDHNLSGEQVQDGWPSWGPDGRICFVRRSSNGKLGIYVMNSEGADVRQVTDLVNDCTNPRWSPDGAQIIFTRRSGCIVVSMVPAPNK